MSDANADYREVFGRNPEPWRAPLGALRLTIHTDPEFRYNGWNQRLKDEVEELVRVLNTEPGDGKKPNGRHGFHHIHSNITECGIAYRDEDRMWQPCRKPVNHADQCGYADNTCF